MLATATMLVLATGVVGAVATVAVDDRPLALKATAVPGPLPVVETVELPVVAGVYVIQPGDEGDLVLNRDFCKKPRPDQVIFCSA